MAVEVTSAPGPRPVVVLSGPLPGLTERLARAGFAVVSFDPPGAAGLEIALDALGRGVLELEADSYALLEPRADGSVAVARAAAGARSPAVTLPNADAMVQWLVKHLV